MAVRAAETGTGIAKEIRDKYTRTLKIIGQKLLQILQYSNKQQGIDGFIEF